MLKIPKIVWTTLPNGINPISKNLKISVFIAPRLESNANIENLGKYSMFPNWPDYLMDNQSKALSSFRFEFDKPEAALQAKFTGQANFVGGKPEAKLWAAIFSDETYVRPFKFDAYDKKAIASYPAKTLENLVKNEYGRVALLSGDDLPAVSDIYDPSVFDPDKTDLLANKIGRHRKRRSREPRHPPPTLDDSYKNLDLYFEQRELRKPPYSGADLYDSLLAFLQLHRSFTPHATPHNALSIMALLDFFHRRKIDSHPTTIQQMEFDFHQALGALGDYPELMKWLGLVFDLEIPVPSGIANQGHFRIINDAFPENTNNCYPWTKYNKSDVLFVAASRDSDIIRDGMLRFDNTRYFNALQVDIDGAGLNLQKYFDATVGAQSIYKTSDTPDRQALPSLRSGGISVARSQRAEALLENLGTANALNKDAFDPNKSLVLHAEDVMRGFRVDVHDNISKQWHSLCRRVGRLRFTNIKPVKERFIGRRDSDTEPSEGLVSLSATSDPVERTDTKDDKIADILYLNESLFRWDGWSLSAPRPGKLIRNPKKSITKPFVSTKNSSATAFNLEVEFKVEPGTLPRLRYGANYRLRARIVDLAGNSVPLGEPVNQDFRNSTEPVFYSRFEPVNNPLLLPRVSKFEPGESMDTLAVRNYLDGKAITPGERHVLPPRVAQLMAENHGMFDGPSKVDAQAYGLIINREQEVPPSSGTPQFRYFDGEQVPIDYLPDPFAVGAAFRFLPNHAAEKTRIVGFYKRDADSGEPVNAEDIRTHWPEAQPFRLKLSASNQNSVDWNNNILQIMLAPAEQVRIRYSSWIPDQHVPTMGQFRWENDAYNSSAIQVNNKSQRHHDFQSAAVMGKQWMLTPYRELLLVHAVKRPLQQPDVSPLGSDPDTLKEGGATHATLYGYIGLHGKSTGKIDLLARWSEVDDDVTQASGIRVRPASTLVFETPIYLNDQPVAVNGGFVSYDRDADILNLGYQERREFSNPKHEFGDTKHRLVTYSTVAATRFREYFSPTRDELRHGDNEGTIDSSRLREQEIAAIEKTFTINGNSKAIHIPNSARPPAPQVLYVIPTFSWEESRSGNTFTSRRLGGGLRVYLQRPWFESGVDELLGILLKDEGDPSDKLINYLTVAGADPIWDTKKVAQYPQTTDFLYTAATRSHYTLEEMDNAKTAESVVSVVGYQVQHDPERGLWYSDLRIQNQKSYWPFIRLAFVRFQPYSIRNTHLSRVSVSDFVQIPPPRTTKVTVVSADAMHLELDVQVSSASYYQHAGHKSSSISVAIQRQEPGVSDESLGWITSNEPVELNHKYSPSFLGLGEATDVWSRRIRVSRPFDADKTRLLITETENLRKTNDKRIIFADSIILSKLP